MKLRKLRTIRMVICIRMIESIRDSIWKMDMEIEWYGGWGRRDMNDRLIVIGWDRKKSCGGLGVKGWQARKEKLWDKYAVWIKVVMDEEKKKKKRWKKILFGEIMIAES